MNKCKWYPILLIIWLFFLSAGSFAGCKNPLHIYENGAIARGDGGPIELINNPDATNPTYAELIAFITADATDERLYSSGYNCSDFAEDVHNNAEAAGIRAAWVGIDFGGDDEGHACNAFETTNLGLIYIDCTGENPESQTNLYSNNPTSWDKVAYVEIGKEYGVIAVDKAKPYSYSFYEEYKQKWQERKKLLNDYNEEIMRYNQEIEGKVYQEGSPELARIIAWEARLEEKSRVIDELTEEVGDFRFEPKGVVKDIHMHWGGVE